MENLELFGDIEEVETKAATRRAMNAIKWLCAKGYRPTIGGLKNLKNFELCNSDTGEVERFDIDAVLAEYDQERKDEARARAAERRLEKNGGNAWQR